MQQNAARWSSCTATTSRSRRRRCAAQIGFDLSVKRAMAFFSWPSQGSTRGYPADEATIEASEGIIAAIWRSRRRAGCTISRVRG